MTMIKSSTLHSYFQYLPCKAQDWCRWWLPTVGGWQGVLSAHLPSLHAQLSLVPCPGRNGEQEGLSLSGPDRYVNPATVLAKCLLGSLKTLTPLAAGTPHPRSLVWVRAFFHPPLALGPVPPASFTPSLVFRQHAETDQDPLCQALHIWPKMMEGKVLPVYHCPSLGHHQLPHLAPFPLRSSLFPSQGASGSPLACLR